MHTHTHTYRRAAHTHTHDAGMLMSLAFLKVLLSSWHCRLVGDMVSLALIYLFTLQALEVRIKILMAPLI